MNLLNNPLGSTGGIISLVLAILVILDVVNQKKQSTLEKILWIVGSFVIPIIIPIVYYFVVYKK